MYKVWNDFAEIGECFHPKFNMPLPSGILMVSPEYFNVVDIKNTYMRGNLNKVNLSLAQQQWEDLYSTFKSLKDKGVISHLRVVEGVEGLEDMVFCANPLIYWLTEDGAPIILLSNMRFFARQPEVTFFEKYFQRKGVKTIQLSADLKLEGNGDLIPHPGKRVIWMGYGFRTDFEAAQYVVDSLDTHVIPLKLIDDNFYHLDTCFCIIDQDTVAICKNAFDDEGLKMIQAGFKKVWEIPFEEAVSSFALNSLVLTAPDGELHAILPMNIVVLKSCLMGLKATIVEVETSEYLKSGGSVYCMKMLTYE